MRVGLVMADSILFSYLRVVVSSYSYTSRTHLRLCQ